MQQHDKETFIRAKAAEHVPEFNDKMAWSAHAVRKLRFEQWRKTDFENALKECVLIEDYGMEGRPLPGCLVLGFIEGLPVHAVVAIDVDHDRIFVITIYKPSLERWENDWKRRKQAI